MKRIMTLLAFFVLVAGPETVRAQDVGALLKGGEIAQQICAECHAVQKGQRRSPNAQAPTFETVATTPGMTTIALTVVLRTSHRAMPNIVLTDDDLRNVVAYILNLQ
jgi:mono/diheme cytochrome c family protein